jgi:hypothetical protein
MFQQLGGRKCVSPLHLHSEHLLTRGWRAACILIRLAGFRLFPRQGLHQVMGGLQADRVAAGIDASRKAGMDPGEAGAEGTARRRDAGIPEARLMQPPPPQQLALSHTRQCAWRAVCRAAHHDS